MGIDIDEYFEEEIMPHLENAWINTSKRYCDDKDGQPGIVGYEISFDRKFYHYSSVRDPSEITAEVKKITEDIESLVNKLEQ